MQNANFACEPLGMPLRRVFQRFGGSCFFFCILWTWQKKSAGCEGRFRKEHREVENRKKSFFQLIKDSASVETGTKLLHLKNTLFLPQEVNEHKTPKKVQLNENFNSTLTNRGKMKIGTTHPHTSTGRGGQPFGETKK